MEKVNVTMTTRDSWASQGELIIILGILLLLIITIYIMYKLGYYHWHLNYASSATHRIYSVKEACEHNV